MGNIRNSFDEDNKILDELYSHAPQDRDNVLKWYGRSRDEFSWVDFGDEQKNNNNPRQYRKSTISTRDRIKLCIIIWGLVLILGLICYYI